MLLTFFNANILPFVFQCASLRFLASFFSRLVEVVMLPRSIKKSKLLDFEKIMLEESTLYLTTIQ